MNYITEVQDSLITEDNSQGIIGEAEVREVTVEVPDNFRMEGVEETLTPSVELGEAVTTLEAEPDTYSMGSFGDPFGQRSDAVRLEQEEVNNTTWFESVKASAQLWDVVGAYNQATLEDKILNDEADLYAPEPDFKIQEAINLTPIPLSKEEARWLEDKGITSQGAYDLYIDKIKADRELAKTASQAPVTNFALGFVDPTYIPLGLGVGKVAQVARLGRFGTSAVVGASEYAMIEAQQYHRPVDNVERVLGVVLPSVITLGVYRNPRSSQRLDGTKSISEEAVVGKAKISEPVYDSNLGKSTISEPNKTTVDYAGNIDEVNAVRNTPLVDNPQQIKPKTNYKTNEYGMPTHDSLDWNAKNNKGVPLKDTAYKYIYDVIENKKIPKSIRESSVRLLMQAGRELAEVGVSFNRKLGIAGRFNLKTGDIELKGREGGKLTGSTLNHEIVHALTSLRLHYAKLNPDSAHGSISRDITDLKEHVKSEFNKSKGEFNSKQIREIEYALKDNDEFLAGLYEGDTAFRRLMDRTPADHLKSGNEKSLLQVLYNGFRKLLGLTTEESRALNKALRLSEDLIDTPMVRYTDVNGNTREFRASEITPEVIRDVASSESEDIFKEVAKTSGSSFDTGWNLHKTLSKASKEFADTVLSSPYQNDMGSNVVSSKRALTVRLGIPRTNAEQMFRKEITARGVSRIDRAFNTANYQKAVRELEAEVAYYVESRSQAEKLGRKLPEEDTPVARIAQEYNKMTTEAKEAGIRSGIFDEEVNKVNYYLPRKIDPENYAQTLEKFKVAFGEEDAVNRLIDYIAKSFKFTGKDAEYARHIAYIYHKRMHDRYHSAGDQFKSHMGNELVGDIGRYLDELNVTDKLARQHIEDMLTGAIDKRGEASFQKSRLDINTLQEFALPDGSSFRFYDLMEQKVLDPYSRYADNVSGRIALADHGLGTPTLRAEARESVTGNPEFKDRPDLRKRYGELVDDIFDNILGYPVGKQLHPFLIALRAFTQSVSLKFSGIWQVMEAVPTLARHAKANGLADTFKIAGSSTFKSIKTLERTQANDLVTVLARGSMDDLKISPISSRMADNHSISQSTFSAKMMHLSQWTHVLNGMRFLMGKQSIMSANLIVDTLKKATTGNSKSATLLKKYGMNDRDIKIAKSQLDKYGTDFGRWDLDSKSDLLPKLMNLMDTDVLRSRLGEVPAIMEFSNVGKVLGTFRNFILSAHNKIFASQLKDEGVLAVALLTAYQLPVAMLSVQVASIARGEEFIEDPVELLRKAFAQLGGLGLIPEMVGILSGDTRSFGSPFMLGVDRVIGIGNSLGNLATNAIQGEVTSSDFTGVAKAGVGAIPLLSVTLGFQAGIDAILGTFKETIEE